MALNQQKKAKKRQVQTPVVTSSQGIEKTQLNLGFLPLTDAAPLIVAQEKGFFAKHGLTQVNLVKETSWQAIANKIASGNLDAAQMVAGMPLAMTIGMKDQPTLPIVTALTLSHNGSAITLSNELFEQGVRTLADFKQAISNNSDRVYTLGIVNEASMHNLMLRSWLAADGIDPDRDVNLVVIPPSEMITNLKAGKIDGFCAGEPGNTQAVAEKVGFVIATDLDIWPSYLEKVLGVREDWSSQYPKTHISLIKALIEACQYCDDRRNRDEIAELIAQPEYLDIATKYIRPGFIEPYNRGTGEPAQMLPQYNEFSINKTNFPSRVQGLWILVQMARWGIVPFPRNWIEVLDKVRRSDLYSEAARQLNLPGLEPERNSFTVFDGTVFNPDNPLAYLQGLAIKQEIKVEEVQLDSLVKA